MIFPVRATRKTFEASVVYDNVRRSSTDLDLPTLYFATSIMLATISIMIIVLGVPGRILRWWRPVTISSPVFEVSQFGLLTEHEFPVDLDKQLKGVPIFLRNRGARRCIIEALWLEPHGKKPPRLPPKLPLIITYKDSAAIDPGREAELRVFPETPTYLEKICKSWETDLCQIYASCPPYPIARSRKFPYTNWGDYISQIFYGATKRSASALVQMAARQNKTPAETLNLLLEHYGRLIPITLTSLVYSQMTLKEVAKPCEKSLHARRGNSCISQICAGGKSTPRRETQTKLATTGHQPPETRTRILGKRRVIDLGG
jgi:hypothetical protein